MPTTSSTYRVRADDTLSKIAAGKNLDLQDLIAANPQIKDPDVIYKDQVINLPVPGQEPLRLSAPEPRTPIPQSSQTRQQQTPTTTVPAPIQQPTQQPTQTGAATHRVQRGENLTRIANRYNTTVDELVRLNNIANPNLIEAGEDLILPTQMTVEEPRTNPFESSQTSLNEVQTAGESFWLDALGESDATTKFGTSPAGEPGYEEFIAASNRESNMSVAQLNEELDAAIGQLLEGGPNEPTASNSQALAAIQTRIDDGYEKLQDLQIQKQQLKQDILNRGGGRISRSILTALVAEKGAYINQEISLITGQIKVAQNSYKNKIDAIKAGVSEGGVEFIGVKEVGDNRFRALYRVGGEVYARNITGLTDAEQQLKENDFADVKITQGNVMRLIRNPDGSISYQLIKKGDPSGSKVSVNIGQIRGSEDVYEVIKDEETGQARVRPVLGSKFDIGTPPQEGVLAAVDAIAKLPKDSPQHVALEKWAEKDKALAAEFGFDITHFDFFGIGGKEVSEKELVEIKKYIVHLYNSIKNPGEHPDTRNSSLAVYNLLLDILNS